MLSPLEEYDLHDNQLVRKLNEKPKQAETVEKKPVCTICKGAGSGSYCENCGKK